MKELSKAAGRFLLRHWPLTVFFLFAISIIMTPHAMERFFVYYPIRGVSDDPASIGLPFENITLVTEDSLKLHAWFVPREGASVTLMIFHGNAGNIGHRVPWIDMLRQTGAHVFILDYRGYGNSEGKPHEQGLYRDARAAYAWWREARRRTGEKLVLFGESLGGSVAVDLAASEPVAAVILQSTFTSAWDMAKTLMPLGLLQPLAGIHFDSTTKILQVTCPKLFVHGNRDEIVPFRLGRKLFDLAPERKEFYEVAGAGHNDLPWIAGREYVVRIRRFLESL